MRGTFGHLSVGALVFLMGDTSLRVSTLHKVYTVRCRT